MKLKSKLNKLFINTVCEFPYQTCCSNVQSCRLFLKEC